MGDFVDLYDKIKKYYGFSKQELRSLIITIIAVAFIISFDEWGTAEFNIAAGFFNLFNAILITAFSYLIKISAQRIGALQIGYRCEHRMWSWGILLGIILAFVSNGSIWFLMTTSFIVHHMAGHRLGWFRYGINYFAIAMVALWGPLANVLLVLFFKGLSCFISNPLIEKAILLNALMAIYAMVPIPPMEGSKIYWGSRLAYVFSAVSIILASLLLIFIDIIWLAILTSFLLGLILWIVYYIYYERYAWSGPAGDSITATVGGRKVQ